MLKWYEKTGKDIDVVICTKLSLARNISEYVFVNKLDSKSKQEICDKVKETLKKSCDSKFIVKKMSELSRVEAISLAERSLVSPEFVTNIDGRELLMQEDESISIMLCEEDHIKIQAILSGLEVDKAYNLSDKVDAILDENFNFSFSAELGYLTQCPTNIGTAMRASVLLHLPALSSSTNINKLSTTVSKLGLTLSSVYGGFDTGKSNIYLLSNQVTLGISEKSAIENLNSITQQIIEQERQARKSLLEDLKYQDLLWRSCGTLQNARILSFDEFINNISKVKVGAYEGVVDVPIEKLNELIITMQPATISLCKGEKLDRQERDIVRAEKVREIFK